MNQDASQPDETIDWHRELTVNREWLMGIAMSRLGNNQDADEVVQEVSVAVIQQSERPTNLDLVRPWLYQVTVRKVADHFRNRYRKEALTKGYADSTAVAASTRPDSDPLVLQEQAESFEAALNRLPEQYRKVLILKYTENESYRDIALQLQISQRSVEYLIVQAKKQLRRELASTHKP